MDTPFTTFNFLVQLTLPGGSSDFVCAAEFSECSGLEMSMEPKTIKEGGNNGRQIHLAGRMSYGQLTLRRGMTSKFLTGGEDKVIGLWDWFEKVYEKPSLRATGKVVMRSPDRKAQAVFKLSGCLPVKLKAPALNAKESQVAIEEMQIAYERLSIARPSS